MVYRATAHSLTLIAQEVTKEREIILGVYDEDPPTEEIFSSRHASQLLPKPKAFMSRCDGLLAGSDHYLSHHIPNFALNGHVFFLCFTIRYSTS
jgi:hypothetical protein